jgi:ABC-type iron transport system FetAB ATPase subunit
MRADAGLILERLKSPLRGPFSITFDAGRCAVLTGPSGVGKSLLLRMIADLDPNEGRVLLGDVDRDAIPAPRWRKFVTYVAAEAGWWAERVVDHMADRVAALDLAPRFGLDGALLDASVARLSTGERQRAALIRAIVNKPRFLLLDEPTSALDQDTKLLVEGELARLKREGLGLIVVSHDPAQAERIADRRLVMSANGLSQVAT